MILYYSSGKMNILCSSRKLSTYGESCNFFDQMRSSNDLSSLINKPERRASNSKCKE
ncbi:hypothetical protein HHX47_DHR3001211, partial [Lentinula edodes]